MGKLGADEGAAGAAVVWRDAGQGPRAAPGGLPARSGEHGRLARQGCAPGVRPRLQRCSVSDVILANLRF